MDSLLRSQGGLLIVYCSGEIQQYPKEFPVFLESWSWQEKEEEAQPVEIESKAEENVEKDGFHWQSIPCMECLWALERHSAVSIFSYTVDCSAGSVEVSKLKLKVYHWTRMIHVLPFPCSWANSFPAFSFFPSAGRGFMGLVACLNIRMH